MKAYKGFNKDMTCRGFQFEEGKTYEEKEAKLCHSGFHACEYPLDVFGYYNPANSVFHEVELGEVDPARESDSKVSAKKITIGARLSIHRLVELSVEYINTHIDKTKKQHVMKGYRSASTNTGDRSASTNTGYRSASTNTGNCSASTNTGYRSASANTGYCSASTNTGYCSASTNTGECSASTNTGDYSASKVTGKQSIAVATGYHSKASGGLGCWIVLAEWNERGEEIIDMKMARVDGEKIKADTWYRLQGGEFVEEEE